MAYNTVTVAATATLIVSANTRRIGLILCNTDSSTSIYIGPDASITTANAIELEPKGTYSHDSGGEKMWQGNVYGIVGAGTADIRYWEQTR